MAELAGDFIAERLTSRELLALLFVCECRRKKVLDAISLTGGNRPRAWTEFLDRFMARLEKLPEDERRYLVGSHLQSTEEINIYSNSEIGGLFEQYEKLITVLIEDLIARKLLE